MDMGVYQVTALVALLGPVESVTAVGRRMRQERAIHRGPRQGERFSVDTPTHIAATLTFASEVSAGLLVSFDVPASRQPGLELMGTTATVCGPGASFFGGDVKRANGLDGWETSPPAFAGWDDQLWAIGVLDTLDALDWGRPPRCSATLALHVQDVLLSIETAIASGDRVRPATSALRPPPFDAGDYGRLRERFL
jgi:predicted dehydrogenase